MRRFDATRIFYGMEFFDTLGAQAAFTVWAVYLVQDVGVNPLQLVLLGTVSEIAVFLFEVPTGVVADTYSRRLSIIIGIIMAGLSMVIFGLVAVYWVIVLAVILRGIGGTFMSGAWEAWITDEHGVDGIGRVFLRGDQFSYLGAIAGSALGVGIATWDLGAGIVFGGIVSVLTGIVCIFVMPEHGFHRRPVEERSSPLRAMRTTAVTGGKLVRGHNILLLIVGITFLMLATAAAVNVVPSAALDPPPPIAAEPLTARSVFPDLIDMKLKLKSHYGGTTVINDDNPSRTVDVRYTVQPGARFPWHTHYGPVIVNIVSG